MAFGTVHTTKCRGYNVATQTDPDTGAWAIAWSKGQKDGTFTGATWEEARDAMRAELGFAPETPYSPECS